MDALYHILSRFVIHFTSATALVLIVFMGLRSIRRRFMVGEWLPESWRSTLVLAALGVFAASALREAFDVAQGQSQVKAVTDYISWVLGCGVAAWGLHRFAKEAR